MNSEPNTSIDLKYSIWSSCHCRISRQKRAKNIRGLWSDHYTAKEMPHSSSWYTQKEKDNIIPKFILPSYSAYKPLFSILILTSGKDAESSTEETEHMDAWYPTHNVLITITFPTLNMELHACSWDLPLGRKCSIGIKYHNYSGFNNTISLSFKVFTTSGILAVFFASTASLNN